MNQIIDSINLSFDVMLKKENYSNIIHLNTHHSLFNKRYLFSKKINYLNMDDLITEYSKHNCLISNYLFNILGLYKTDTNIFPSHHIKNNEGYLINDSGIDFSFFLGDDFVSTDGNFTTMKISYKFEHKKLNIEKNIDNMTLIDVRIKFKMATGNNALWTDSLLHGKKKSIYGLWMEEELGDPIQLRNTYFKEENDLPVFRSRSVEEWLSSGYMNWLEEKLMKEM